MPWSGTTSACYQRCNRRFPGGTKITETTQQRRTAYNTAKRDQFSERADTTTTTTASFPEQPR